MDLATTQLFGIMALFTILTSIDEIDSYHMTTLIYEIQGHMIEIQ